MKADENFVVKHPCGRKVTYKRVGDVRGRPVVYFHGWGSAASSVFFDADFLMGNGLFVLLVNRPGYGGSDLVKGYSMFDHADDVKFVMDHLGIGKADLIGWSNGGLFSQVFAYRYPHYVTSLSLAGSAIPLKSKESSEVLPLRWKIIKTLDKIAPFLNRKYVKKVNKNWTGAIGRKLLKLHNKSRNGHSVSSMKAQLKKQTTEGIWEAYRSKGWAEYFELHAMMKPFKLKDWKAPFPVYIWGSDRDKIWPLKTTAFLQKKFQQSHLHIVKGKGHFFFLVCWEDILKKTISSE